jgi:hypothetical protein
MLKGLSMEVVKHALVKDGKDPSIMDPDAKQSIQGLPVGTVRSIRELDVVKPAVGQPANGKDSASARLSPSKDPAYAKVSAHGSPD